MSSRRAYAHWSSGTLCGIQHKVSSWDPPFCPGGIADVIPTKTDACPRQCSLNSPKREHGFSPIQSGRSCSIGTSRTPATPSPAFAPPLETWGRQQQSLANFPQVSPPRRDFLTCAQPIKVGRIYDHLSDGILPPALTDYEIACCQFAKGCTRKKAINHLSGATRDRDCGFGAYGQAAVLIMVVEKTSIPTVWASPWEMYVSCPRGAGFRIHSANYISTVRS